MLRQLLNDESGVIISAELVLVLTIGVLAMVVGLSEVTTAVVTELNDISNAIGAANQSMGVTGFVADGGPAGKIKAFIAGWTFIDTIDDCDTNTTCEIVVGASAAATVE
jgi:Flp pilus assembly pilin Flp